MSRPTAADQALLLVGMQDRPFRALPDATRRALLESCSRLAGAAARVGVPVLCTELDARAQGRVVPGLPGTHAASHDRYSALTAPAVLTWLQDQGRRHVVVAGLELHLAVAQTALDLLAAGYGAAVVLDASASRREVDARAAELRLVQAGVVPMTTDAQIYEWVDEVVGALHHELSRAQR